MRKSRFSEVQTVRLLRQADAGEKTIGQLCRGKTDRFRPLNSGRLGVQFHFG